MGSRSGQQINNILAYHELLLELYVTSVGVGIAVAYKFQKHLSHAVAVENHHAQLHLTCMHNCCNPVVVLCTTLLLCQ